MTCSIDGCGRARKYAATGWCQTHYHRYWRTGTTSLLPKPVRDDVTYFGAHGRVRAFFGAATLFACVVCGKPADEWAYDGTDPHPRDGSANGYPVTYSVCPEFYMPLCFPCHRARDAGARYERRTRFGCGHERSDDNTYTPPARPRCPECRTCWAANNAARYQARKAQRTRPHGGFFHEEENL